MLQLIPAMFSRQVAAVSVGVGLFALTAALGVIAFGCAAVAIYHHLLPAHGPAVAAWIDGAIFLAAAALVAAVAWARLKRSIGAEAPKPTGAASPDLALAIAGVLQEKLPKNAVPATLVALLGGLVVGLNPQVAQSLVESLARTSQHE
jgi:hypothetical protein